MVRLIEKQEANELSKTLFDQAVALTRRRAGRDELVASLREDLDGAWEVLEKVLASGARHTSNSELAAFSAQVLTMLRKLRATEAQARGVGA